MNKSYDIFISYRRSDGKLLARLLKESLEKRGYRVFLDMDELLETLGLTEHQNKKMRQLSGCAR